MRVCVPASEMYSNLPLDSRLIKKALQTRVIPACRAFYFVLSVSNHQEQGCVFGSRKRSWYRWKKSGMLLPTV